MIDFILPQHFTPPTSAERKRYNHSYCCRHVYHHMVTLLRRWSSVFIGLSHFSPSLVVLLSTIMPVVTRPFKGPLSSSFLVDASLRFTNTMPSLLVWENAVLLDRGVLQAIAMQEDVFIFNYMRVGKAFIATLLLSTSQTTFKVSNNSITFFPFIENPLNFLTWESTLYASEQQCTLKRDGKRNQELFFLSKDCICSNLLTFT